MRLLLREVRRAALLNLPINNKTLPLILDRTRDTDDDSTASRFTAFLLRELLPGFEAKDKNVRYRTLQTVAEMVSHLGEIE